MSKRKITWGKRATLELNAAIKYIRQDSEQNAEKVKARILNKINELSDASVVHRKDPYKKNNDGNYLYFELLRYRVMYYATPGEVFIIRIRHTKMEPKKYK
jgi:plasmid stabilization system protein ParE